MLWVFVKPENDVNLLAAVFPWGTPATLYFMQRLNTLFNIFGTVFIPAGLYHFEQRTCWGRLKRGMTMLVWHRHSCRCLIPPKGRLRTGRSACATQFLAPMRHLSLGD